MYTKVHQHVTDVKLELTKTGHHYYWDCYYKMMSLLRWVQLQLPPISVFFSFHAIPMWRVCSTIYLTSLLFFVFPHCCKHTKNCTDREGDPVVESVCVPRSHVRHHSKLDSAVHILRHTHVQVDTHEVHHHWLCCLGGGGRGGRKEIYLDGWIILTMCIIIMLCEWIRWLPCHVSW